MIGRRSHDEAQSFDDALSSGRAPRDEHIAELVRFAEGLCEIASVEPSAHFRSSLRSQLMAEAVTVLEPMPSTPRLVTSSPTTTTRPVRRRVASVTAALVASAGVVGIVASSASAVPGEMLYPVKRSVESVELQLHRDDASRGSFQLAQASERLAEARRLSADGQSSSLIADSLDDFSTAAASGSSKLFSDYSSTGQEASIREVNEFAATSSLDLSALSGQLPEQLADSFAAASAAVTDLATEASSLCASCDPADVRALVGAVTDAARSDDASTAAAQPSQVPVKTPAATKPPVTRSPAAASSSTPQPATSQPSSPAPAAPSKTPSLSTITDPLVGGLLGNEQQPGLVPGLLNGLLGNTQK